MRFNKTIILILLSSVALLDARSQSGTASNSKGFGVRFRSVQVEAGTLVFVNTISAACDLDLVDIGSGFTAGIRGGVQHASKRSFTVGGGGTMLGSPYTDIDLLFRLSSSDGGLAEDILVGYTRHHGTAQPPQTYQASGKFKFGGEVRWLLFKPVGGLFVGVNSTIGGATKPVTVLVVGIVIGLGW
ncbi:MAG: hypothetical protein HY961_22160 [Ignavibacteriae bacterium]|nr:hypothetical protein [Ignavibacteriota bacterium]